MDEGKKRMVDITLEDFTNYLQERGFIQGARPDLSPIKGYAGLAHFLDVSYNTARRYCSQGLFDTATTRVGNNVRFDRKKVIDILRKRRNLGEVETEC